MASIASYSGLPSPAKSSRIPRLRSERPSPSNAQKKLSRARSTSPRQFPVQQSYQESEQRPHATVQNGSKDRVFSLALDNSSTFFWDNRTSTPVPVHRHRNKHILQDSSPHSPSPSSSGTSSPVRPSSRINLRYTPTSKLSSNIHRYSDSLPCSPAASTSCNESIAQCDGLDLPLPSNRVQTPRLHRVRQQLCPSRAAESPASPSSRRLPTNLRPLQVPPSPISPALSSSPFNSASFPTTPQHPRPFQPKPTYAYLGLQQQPSSSYQGDIADSPSPPSRFESAQYSDFDTPSPSPRTHRLHTSYSSFSTPSSRQNQRHQYRSSLPSPPTPSFLIRRGLLPHRAKPTLAMSIQIHAPTPIISTRPLSPPSQHPPLPIQSQRQSRSRSRSRPSSPLSVITQLPQLPPTSPLARPPMTRPPSRSEKLLRDTLRKAEEQERLASFASLTSPPLSAPLAPAFVLNPKSSSAAAPRRHVRRNTSSSSGTDASFGSIDYFKGQPLNVDALDPEDDENVDMVDGEGWLWRTRSATSASSSSSIHLTGQSQIQGGYYPSRAGLARQNSMDKAPSVYSRSRAHTDPTGGDKFGELAPAAEIVYGTPVSPRVALQRSSKSSPNIPRPAHSKRASAEYMSHDNVLLMKTNGVVTPHEAVLRSRLEGVLRGAKEQERRTRSRERGGSGSGNGSGSGSGASNSMASSRNLSGEGDFFFGGAAEYTGSPMSEQTSAARRRASTTSPRQSSTTTSSTHTTTARRTASPRRNPQPSNLLTPPPTPPSPFNAHTAAAQCRAMDGYVSFATIEGLGVPGGEEYEGEEESGRKGKWLKWLSVGAAVKGRDRSDSASSVASR